MKHSVWVLNVASGSMIDPAALETALGNQQIGGAYLDMTDPEPLPTGSPLWYMPNVIVTPHSSGSSSGSPQRAAAVFLCNLARYRQGQPLRNLVDLSEAY